MRNKVPTAFFVRDGAGDIHVITTTEAQAKEWIEYAKAKYPGTSYLVFETQFLG